MKEKELNKLYRKNKKNSLELLGKNSNKKFILPLLITLISILGVWFVMGLPTITNIFPTTDIVTSNDTINISYGIEDNGEGINSITHSWNGTNYTFYDENLVLFMNFDNRSELGENDTFVRDLSRYGNNGTVVGESNITWTPNGRFNGDFNFTGNKAYIYLGTPRADLGKAGNYTYSLWFKTTSTTAGLITNTLSSSDRNDLQIVASKVTGGYYDGSTTRYIGSNSNVPSGWNHVVYVKNGTTLNLYLNGVNQSGTTQPSYDTGVEISIGKFGTTYFNGSIDDVMLFNRSLSDLEIKELYKTQITRFNESYLTYNLTNLDTSILTKSTFLCSANLTNGQTCSASKTIRSNDYVYFNFSTSKGIIRSDFYGVNIQRISYGSYTTNVTYVDSNNDSIVDTPTDFSWHEKEWANSNLDYFREEIKLNSLYSNNSGTPTFVGNITKITKEVEWACDNNKMVLLNLYTEIPLYLANKTSDCYSSNITCTPNDFIEYQRIVVDIINRSTNNGVDISCVQVEFGNEPEITSFFLINLTADNVKRAVKFNEMYNSTWNALKTNFPTIKVGGYGASLNIGASANIRYLNMLNGFLSNFSNQTDFLSVHVYSSNINTFTQQNFLETTISYLMNNISNYNGNFTNVIFSEFNTGSANVHISTNGNYSKDIAYGFSTFLNTYPSNYSIVFFQWAETYYYGNPSYPEAPKKWSMVSEPQLDNTYYPPYNVTKNFAHLCPAGGSVYVSSSDDDSLKTVSCKKGNMYSEIIINTGTEARNVTMNMSLTNGSVFFPYSKLTNYENNSDIYTITDGIAQLGVMDSYDILYLVNDSQEPSITINSPTNTTYLTNSVWFNLTLDEEGSKCIYSLNSGTNTSLTQSGVNSQFYKYVTGIEQIHNTVRFWCNDSYNNWNTTTRSFTVSTSPTYSDNSASNTVFGGNVKFELTVTDDIALENNGYWIFSSDNTGEWKNDTAVNFTSTPETISVRKDIIKDSNTNLSYKWYLVDNIGNTNMTEDYYFTVSCSNNSMVGYKVIMITASLLLLSIFGFIAWRRIEDGETLTVGQIVLMVILIAVCASLWLASGQTIGTSCGVIS